MNSTSEAVDAIFTGHARIAIETLAIQNEHAFLAGRLPPHHRDPFDRMLIAQTRIESMCLISNDVQFKHYEADLSW